MYYIYMLCFYSFYSDFHNLPLFTECPQKCAVTLWRGISTRSPQLVNILYVSIILFLPLFTPLLQFSWRRGVNLITDISRQYPTILASQKVICFSHFILKIFSVPRAYPVARSCTQTSLDDIRGGHPYRVWALPRPIPDLSGSRSPEPCPS